jgi:hypothetical protein
MVDDLLPHPAHLMEAASDLVSWNAAYARLFEDPARLPIEHRNGLRIQLMSDQIRSTLVNWEAETFAAIARFRAEAAKYPEHPRFSTLILELSEASETFRDAWARHEVHRFTEHVEEIEHPVVGLIRAEVFEFRPLGQPSIIMMVHRLVDDESRDRMNALLAADDTR